MTRFYIAFLYLLLGFSCVFSQATYNVPDFAFPKQVKTGSDSLLKIAIANHDQVTTLREAMNICISQALLDDDKSLQKNINLIDSVIPHLSSPYSNIACLLEADILNQEYSSNLPLYDSRNLPVDLPFPSDPLEWSAEMFKTRIYSLLLDATQNINLLKTDNIQEIAVLLTDISEAEKIHLTIPDFIAFKASALLQHPSTLVVYTPSIIPFYPQEAVTTIEGKSQALAKSLLSSLINGDDSVVKALAIKDYLYLIPDSEKEKYLLESVAKLKGKEGEGLLLYELWNRYGKDSNSYYSDIQDWLKAFPDGFVNSLLRSSLSVMCQQRIEVQFPKLALPDSYIPGSVSVSNLDKGYLLIYKLTPSQFTTYDELILKKFNTSARPIHVIEIGENGIIPFQYKKEVTLPPLDDGLYAIIPSKSTTLPKNFSKASSNSNFSTLRVSEISIITSCDYNKSGSGRAYVVKAHNQQPVSGATVTYYKSGEKFSGKKLVTNSEGWVSIPTGYYRIEASYGKSVAKTEAGFNYNPVKNTVQYHASILTDLALYHPGDTVRYAVVGWKQDNTVNSLVKNSQLEVSLHDANYIKIDCDTLFLNEEGRASGEFFIPKDRLLGSYFISATFIDKPGRGGGVADISVEDYKLPAFMVTLEKLESPMPNVIRFKGLASTFSGMPITDANVNVEVKYLPWRWGFYGGNASYNESLSTGSDGYFEVTLPLEGLKNTPFETGRFSITAEVTALSGDSQKSSPLIFYLGNSCDIRPSISDKIEVKGDSINLHIPVYDIAGLPIKTSVEYRFINLYNQKDTLSGAFQSPTLRVLSDSIPSGKYRLEFRTSETSAWTTTETIFWRSCDDHAPYPTPLWIPVSDYSYSPSDKAVKVSFGSYYADWLLCIISDGYNVLDTKWIAPSDSLINLDVTIPEGNPTLFVTLSGMHDFEPAYGEIKIVPAKALEKLSVETVSFREDISAGSQENWSFRFTVDKSSAPYVNAFAVLSDKALNSIRDFKWNLNFWQQGIYPKVRINSQSYISHTSFLIVNPSTLIPKHSYPIPLWQTYNYPLVSSAGVRFGGPVLYKAMATRNTMLETAMADEAADETLAEGGQGAAEAETDLQLRPVEMPLAFFLSDLKADETGEISINFTVPNFNTTWQLQVVGYNEELLNSTLLLDAVAAKPVMVKSNLPQFLRTGDKAQFSATLFNNSEDTIPVFGKIEILNPISGEILSSKDFPASELLPSANRVINISFEVPDSLSIIAVRSYTYGNGCSDGEQGFIRILPSSTPVTESKVFYSAPAKEFFEKIISEFPKDANVTVKYCDNPVWEVLLSLPALKDDNTGGSLSITNWLYSTLLSMDILKSNPELATRLQGVLESEDSTLSMSNLEKDQYLKISALETTPWINNATADTERIRSLGMYLDTSKIALLIDDKTDALKNLQNADGGFAWFSGMKSSPFVTAQIIASLGYLNERNILTPSLLSMARKAVNYYDSYVLQNAKKSSHFNALSLMDYFYSRNMLHISKSGGLRKLEVQCCDSILANWKHWSAAKKSKGALVLLDNGLDSDANTISASVQEFLNTRLSLNEEALILELLVKTDPQSSAVQTVQRNMFLQKETTAWSSLPDAAGIIASLLLPPYSSMIPAPPTWGAVIAQYIQPVKDVKASKSENISIEKRVFMEDQKGRMKEVKDFNKGDKVSVVLNVNCTKDMDYVVIVDSRSACLQPEDCISGMVNVDGMYAYRELGFDKTGFFFEHLPAGKYIISYDCYVDREGSYSLGIAAVQSLYSPGQSAHSAGTLLKITEQPQ
ncbi:MAG: hypothetical protein J1F67_08400 [Muribaculaceae bacterium]|nr:hypothetical protein [Muribaculaceae bacterium]